MPPIHKLLQNLRPGLHFNWKLFNLACPVKLSLILFNRGQPRPQNHHELN